MKFAFFNPAEIKPAHFVLSCSLSVFLFLFVFVFAVHRPLVLGTAKKYLDHKVKYLQKHANKTKIIILGGSNARFSHRAEVIEAETGFHCVNMGVTANFNVDTIYYQIEPFLKKGDIILAPIEYASYLLDKQGVYSSDEGPLFVAYNRSFLKKFELSRQLHAYFNFDFDFLFRGVGEMVLGFFGFQRRFSLDTMNENGDETGHNDEKARDYVEFIKTLPKLEIRSADLGEETYGFLLIEKVLRFAREKGILVIGSNPTTFDDSGIPFEVLDRIEKLYVRNGHNFVSLQNKSLYPRAYFFDTRYHLREQFQIEHSKELIQEIKRTYPLIFQ